MLSFLSLFCWHLSVFFHPLTIASLILGERYLLHPMPVDASIWNVAFESGIDVDDFVQLLLATWILFFFFFFGVECDAQMYLRSKLTFCRMIWSTRLYCVTSLREQFSGVAAA